MAFLDQILEDIKEYQREYPALDKLKKEEWAFNFWILDKLYYVDPEIIVNQITDYHDDGVDAWVYNEDTNDLYLIQNKYYSEKNPVSLQYVKKEFLVKPDKVLKNGSYSRCRELQDIYNKHCKEETFYLHLILYVTNNLCNENIDIEIKKYTSANIHNIPKIDAEICYLDKIQEKFYGETDKNTKQFDYEFHTINKKTVLQFDGENYGMSIPVDAKYVLASVIDLYKMFKKAKKEKYHLFDRNIREYLGQTGINKGIVKTLQDKKERFNFCYYNNGITINCEKFGKVTTKHEDESINNACLLVTNPQIVNGCQTMNSIFAALDAVSSDDLSDFNKVYIVCKILQINPNDEKEQEVYKNIVKYNNSQNSIREQDFTSNQPLFIRWQMQFEKRGFCLLVKPSDKNKFKEKYGGNSFYELKKNLNSSLDKFGLEFNKVSDCFIPLDKFLQVIIAFEKGGQFAYTKKSSVLIANSEGYRAVTNRLTSEDITTDILLNLYLLYELAEKKRRSSEDKRTPIPYYLIDGFGKYECEGAAYSKIQEMLDCKEKIDGIIKVYNFVSKQYLKKHPDYNKTIKEPVDYASFIEAKEQFEDALKSI